MPEIPNSSSFIPKRSNGPRVRQRRSHTFFLLSIISYACLIAAPTASAAVYVYSLYTKQQFNEAVNRLDQSISNFREADMATVLEFDTRLKAANALIDSHVSLVRALQIFEQSTLQNVGFTELKFTRTGTDTVLAEASLTTTNFDAALFQRGEYSKSSALFSEATIDNVVFIPPGEEGLGESVTMQGEFVFAQDTIAYESSVASAQLSLPVSTPPESTDAVTPATDVSDAANEVLSETLTP